MSVKRITLVGGTHGNELTGVVLVNKFTSQKTFASSCIPVHTIIANPTAVEVGTRFIDHDLNRCFTENILKGQDGSCYEYLRAKELIPDLSNDGNFIIDLHSTTANMSITLIVRFGCDVTLRAVAWLKQLFPDVYILVGGGKVSPASINSLSSTGLTVEVGAVPNGVVRTDFLQRTESVVHKLIEFLELSASGHEPSVPSEVEIFRTSEKVAYPRDSEGNISAYIHPYLQDQDYQELKAGDMAFSTLFGEGIPYQGESGYPVFINEAAYYRENVAFILARKEKLVLEK